MIAMMTRLAKESKKSKKWKRAEMRQMIIEGGEYLDCCESVVGASPLHHR